MISIENFTAMIAGEYPVRRFDKQNSPDPL